jgi:hypothetical protein
VISIDAGRSNWEAQPIDQGVLADVTYAAQDLTRLPARDLLTLPLLLEDEREVAEESVWKVIAPKGVAVLVEPEDQAAALGRLRGMQMVEVELAMGPWLKLKKTAGWVRAQGGTRGVPAARVPAARVPAACAPRAPRGGQGLQNGAGGEGIRRLASEWPGGWRRDGIRGPYYVFCIGGGGTLGWSGTYWGRGWFATHSGRMANAVGWLAAVGG